MNDLDAISGAIMTLPRTRQLIAQMAVLFETLDRLRVLENDITATPDIRDGAATARLWVQEKGGEVCREIRRVPSFKAWSDARLKELFECRSEF